MSTTGIQEK